MIPPSGLVSNGKLTIDDTTHFDVSCSVMGSAIDCKKEQYKYDGKTGITLPTITNSSDCLGSMISEFGGDPSSVYMTYDPKGDSITINAMGFQVPLTHAACKPSPTPARISDSKAVAVAGDDPELKSVCGYIQNYLPSECSCSVPSKLGGRVNCNVNFLHLDTIGFILNLEPCAQPMSFSGTVYETKIGLSYTWGPYGAGKSLHIPIPGLSVDIPVVGSAGIDAVVGISGNVASVTLKFGLDACVSIGANETDTPENRHATLINVGNETHPEFEKCGADLLPGELPIWLLTGHFSFSSLCNRGANPTITVTGGAPAEIAPPKLPKPEPELETLRLSPSWLATQTETTPPPNRAHCAKLANQTSCDADAVCTWCKCAAVPSSCFDLTDAKRLPAGVFICDKKEQEQEEQQAAIGKKKKKGGDYEDPGATDTCHAGEQAAQIQGVKGAFCSPKCSASESCPAAPKGTTAGPECCVETAGAKKPTYCALICESGETCPKGATCKPVQGVGICTYNK